MQTVSSINLALEVQELFVAIQLSNIFADSKTFNDCIPKIDTSLILRHYHAEKELEGFDLSTFVHTYFQLPVSTTSDYQSDTNKDIEEHLHSLWDVLTKEPNQTHSSCIPLPYPYIVPGGRFQEIYYWDSYFTMLGLQVSKRSDLVESMVNNFAHLIDNIGHIPNGNRSYYESRSQPPFFALMLDILAEDKSTAFVYSNYQDILKKEYNFWMNNLKQLSNTEVNASRRVVKLQDGTILNRYWDDCDSPRPEAYKEDIEVAHQAPEREASNVYRDIRAAAESGWDFSGRWFADGNRLSSIQTTALLPVDLNCLLLYMEAKLLNMAQFSNDLTAINHYTLAIAQRKKGIQLYCWDEENGFYFDYNFQTQEKSTIASLAGVFPLFFELATPAQASKVAQNLEDNFLKAGGLVTTLNETGQQWDSPNGWAPLQWMAYKGLLNYGFESLANEVKKRWIALNRNVYQETGKMTEKYNVLDSTKSGGGGEYPNQDGFGWSNGVLLKFLQ